MHVDRCALDQSLVPFLRVFARAVLEIARADGLAYFHGVPPAGDDLVSVAFHDTY